jgi:DNA-binding MarR family transcriptional regulator
MLRKIEHGLAIRGWKVNKADVKSGQGRARGRGGAMADRGAGPALGGSAGHAQGGGEALLFLTDEQLRKGIEAMFFAYRGFTADPDRILETQNYGRAHHRAIHFIHRSPGTTVTNLLAILGVTKQSLNRVLRTLIDDGLVDSRVGRRDKRERHLFLTDKGAALERQLSDAQRARMRAAYRAAGPQAVAGFRTVLEAMMDSEQRAQYLGLREGGA